MTYEEAQQIKNWRMRTLLDCMPLAPEQVLVERFRAAGLTPLDGKWEMRPCKCWAAPSSEAIAAMDFSYVEGAWPNFHTQPTTTRTTGWERRGDTMHEIETTRTFDEDGKQVGFEAKPTGITRPAGSTT